MDLLQGRTFAMNRRAQKSKRISVLYSAGNRVANPCHDAASTVLFFGLYLSDGNGSFENFAAFCLQLLWSFLFSLAVYLRQTARSPKGLTLRGVLQFPTLR